MKISVSFVAVFLVATVMAEMTADQKHRCEQYTSIFENDTTELQYAYCENIHDGRGFTAGRAGFCTGCGDALLVVQVYTAHKTDNPLARFIPELTRLAKNGSGDTSKLHGYCTAWKEAAKDKLFRQSQDHISDQEYYHPAMAEAKKAGVTTPLGLCAFYDTIIQHGGGDDQDSLHAIVQRTEHAMNGSHATHQNEHRWVLKFLETRRHDLEHPHNKDTQEEWRKSVDRVDAMVKLAEANNWDMNPPMHIKTKNHDQTIH